MKYKIDLIDRIPSEAKNKLNAAGILDMDQLLSLTRTPTGRQELSQLTGILDADLLAWARIADLLRVKGIGVKLAQLLIETEIADSVLRLSQASAEDLYMSLLEQNAKSKRIKAIPPRRAIEELIEEAKGLKQVLFLDILGDFRDHEDSIEIRKNFEKIGSLFIDNTFKSIYRFMIIVSVFFITAVTQIGKIYWAPENLHLAQMMNRAEHYKQLLFFISLIQLLLIVVIVLDVRMKIYELVTYIDKKLDSWFFSKPIYRQVYLDLDFSSEFEKKYKTPLLLGLALVSGYVFLLFIFSQSRFGDNLSAISAAIMGIVLSAIIVKPSIQIMLNIKNKSSFYSASALKRYRVWKLVVWLRFPIIILFFLQFGLVLLNVHRLIASNVYIPIYENSIREIKSDILDISLASESDDAIRDQFIQKYTPELASDGENLILFRENNDMPTEKYWLSTMISLCIWTIISSMAGIFIIPFFMFKKYKQAFLFLFLTLLSYFSENFLSEYAAKLFYLPAGSLTAIIFSGAMILSNTVIFDWVQEETTNEKGFCQVCGHDHEADANYCSRCGNIIETSE